MVALVFGGKRGGNSMFLLKGNLINKDEMIVFNVFNLSVSENNSIDKTNGVIVDYLAQPEHINGKEHIHIVNVKTKEQYFEYVDIPKTKEELMEENIEKMQKALDELILGGMLNG